MYYGNRDVYMRPILSETSISFSPTHGKNRRSKIDILDLDKLFVLCDGPEQMYLYSSQLDSLINPTITSAHNPEMNGTPPIYKFLGYFIRPYSLRLNLPRWFEELDWAPRIHLDDVWIRPATWRIPNLLRERMLKTNRHERLVIFKNFLSIARVPTRFQIGSGDQFIEVWSDNYSSVDIAMTMALDKNCLIQESFLTTGDAIVVRQDNTFHSEIILPFSNQNYERNMKDISSAYSFGISNSGKKYLPRDTWVYYQIYCSRRDGEMILRDKFSPFFETEDVSEICRNSWFYMRYGIPDFHLRIRFRHRGNNDESSSRFESLLKKLHDEGWISRFEISTYEPEIFRYGGHNTISYCENIFHGDSVAAISINLIVNGVKEREKKHIFWMAVTFSMISFVYNFFDTHDARIEAVHSMGGPAGKRLMKSNFKEISEASTAVLTHFTRKSSVNKNNVSLIQIAKVILERTKLCKGDIVEIKRAGLEGKLTVPISDIVWSFCLMAANRIYPSWTRLDEVIAYESVRKILKYIAHAYSDEDSMNVIVDSIVLGSSVPIGEDVTSGDVFKASTFPRCEN